MLFVTDSELSRTLLKIRPSFQEPVLSKLQLMSILSSGPEVEKFLEKPSLVSNVLLRPCLLFHVPLLRTQVLMLKRQLSRFKTPT